MSEVRGAPVPQRSHSLGRCRHGGLPPSRGWCTQTVPKGLNGPRGPCGPGRRRRCPRRQTAQWYFRDISDDPSEKELTQQDQFKQRRGCARRSTGPSVQNVTLSRPLLPETAADARRAYQPLLSERRRLATARSATIGSDWPFCRGCRVAALYILQPRVIVAL
jgi:hypothetical protein